ncbi:MAG: asparagine synthase (glutamine-hydrolyzing), partial [Ignavibacteriaceae bacterium]
GHQPMTSRDNTIIFNGEIYNYKELRDELKKKGHNFVTTSDTEVILKMYEEFGVDCVNQLNGMFAFIIFDKNKNKLFAARDHFGIKPLYFYNDETYLIFGSEIKAILQHPEVQATPNLQAVNQYLTFQFVLGTDTLFKNIYKLSPGHFMSVNLDTMDFSVKKYWEPNFNVDEHHTEEYFVYQLKNLLDDTINIQLRSDVPVGSYLSGGMDSSIVTSLAAKKLEGSFKSFTGAFREGDEFDETKYAREVANTSESELFEIYPTEDEFIKYLPKLIYHLDEPVAGPGLFPQYMVSKLASEKVKVILGGQGGDEIFGGYARYVVAYLEQAIKGAIYESNEEEEHIVSLNSILPNLSHLNNYMPMLREFMKTNAFGEMDERYFKLIDRRNGSNDLYTDDFLTSYNKEEIFEQFKKLFNHPDTKSFYNKMTHFDMTNSLPALLQVEDRVSMAVSIECRVPLLDRRIADLVASMPPAMKFKGAEMKYILKRAAKDIIPKSIFERKDKMGFPVPLHIWANNKASGFFEDVLLSSTCKSRGIFNTENIKGLIHNERAFGRKLWGVLCLELWFQQFIDNDIKLSRKEVYEVQS